MSVDRDEIIVIGELPALTDEFADDAARAAAEAGRISRFREGTREQRIEIARQGQHRYGREISWGKLSRMMTAFEGWQLKLEFRDLSEEI